MTPEEKPLVEVISFEDLSELMSSDKNTLFVFNFWATWCKPCVEEMPSFTKIADKYADEDLEIIFVSLDFFSNLEKKVIPFVKDNEIKSKVVLLNERDPNSWIPKVSEEWSGAIPGTLFINNAKNIRAFHEKTFTFEELDTIISSLIAEK